MSQENIVILSEVMGDLLTGHGASGELLAIFESDTELAEASLKHSQATNALLKVIREKIISEGVPEETA